MIIEERARELWAKSLDDALGGGQYGVILTIIREEKHRIEPIPECWLVKALQSFFPDHPTYANTLGALIVMGCATPPEESPIQSES